MSQVQSVPPVAYLYGINNIARQDYTEPALDFHVSFTGGNPSGLGHDAFQVVVESVILENNIPNVNKYNNTINIQFDGSTFALTIPPANYDMTSFLSTINTWLAAINAGMSMTYNATTEYLTWVLPSGNHTIQFMRPVSSPQFVQNSYMYYNSTYDRFWDLIGFIKNTGTLYASTSSPVNIVGGDPARARVNSSGTTVLKGTSFVDVCVNAKLGCMHMGNLDRNILIRVPITVDYEQTQVLFPPPSRSLGIEALSLDNLRITLFDAWGHRLDTVPDNTQFSMKLILISLNQD